MATIAKFLGGIVGALVIAIAVWALVPASTPAIEGPDAIASLEPVEIGGVDQWLLLRGRDVGKPVLLFLHGGPGAANMAQAQAHSSQLEEHFVVVHWDQRGAGKSCASEVPPASMTVDRLVSDTLEVVAWLRKRFGEEKIYLLGHSWGSVIGVLAVQRDPSPFHAYVGLGQVVDIKRGEEISTHWVTERARADGNAEALEDLASVPPPYEGVEALMLQRKWLGHYGGDYRAGGAIVRFVQDVLTADVYTLAEKLSFYGCAIESLDRMWFELADIDFIRDVKRLEVPVHFFIGRHDYNTPFELNAEWAEVLEAPEVEVLWFEQSAHMANLEEPGLFQRRLIELVEQRTRPGGVR
ncbi:MAG: alpha/beta hydrolase [Myxococcota bacterium]|jgi:pimeloyl-ACP methyl ester carboxylesterase|nr:alpha/beta hydrolase [Myxococcota bacterium]